MIKNFFMLSLLLTGGAIILSGCSTPALECGGANPNECNGQCWSACGANQVFQCEASGGSCGADASNCPATAPHSCNGQCWACAPGQVFKCEISGGTCGADYKNCPADTPNSCNEACWAKCGAAEKFVCDETLGGTCEKK